jgi:glycine dehydrogenase
MASMYAVYHGPDGLRGIAGRAHRMAAILAAGLRGTRATVITPAFFDTVTVSVPGRAATVVAAAAARGINLRQVDADRVSVACDETTTVDHLREVWAAFGVSDVDTDHLEVETNWPAGLRRTSEFLTHPVFHAHRSETAMLRYLRSLSDKDYALDRGMIRSAPAP